MSLSWVKMESGLPSGSYYFYGVGSDSTGQYLVTCVDAGTIYTSTNYGSNWTQQTSGLPISAAWRNVCSNSTGQYLAACGSTGVYTSTNYGLNWTQQTSGLPSSTTWISLCCDSTGQYLAVAYNGGMYTSTNYGLNWTQQTSGLPSANWLGVSCNSSGQFLVAGANNGYIFTSTNRGLNWVQTSAILAQWYGVCTDSTGQYLAACASRGSIYTSVNYGSTWTEQTSGLPPNIDWRGICSDSTGQYLAACAVFNSIYTSDNYGLTWVKQTSNLPTSASWRRISSNSSGQLVFVSSNASGIYKGLYSTYPCFKEDSLILTDKGYQPVQDLRKRNLVQTLRNGFLPIVMIGKRNIVHKASPTRIKDQLYKYSQAECPNIFEPLILTGCHSILVDDFTSEEQKQKTIEINGDTYVTDNKYRLPACADERAIIYEIPGTYTIYHIVLENKDRYMNYGIYANGLLVESCSEWSLKEHFNMELID